MPPLHQLVCVKTLRLCLATLCLLVGIPVYSQVHATVSGTVHDSANHPVKDATVALTTPDGHAIASASTDGTGLFAFQAVAPGQYHLHATSKTSGEGDSVAFSIRANESRTIGISLSSSRTTDTSTPDFFDHPSFTVAGVTDTTNLGGHGSDTITRTKESLAKEITGLRTPTANTSAISASETAAREKADHNRSEFDANYSAGSLLLTEGKPREATTYLERARGLRPGDFSNEYALARALTETGNFTEARKLIAQQLAVQDRAQLHNLLGTVEERSGNPLQAEQQYQVAAKLDPNEQNLFDWGAELLLHHAAEPATKVFAEGARRFSASARMLTALGVAWYIRGSYQQAEEILGHASDLDPKQPTAYLFLGHILAAEPSLSEGTSRRLERFLHEFPQDPRANYVAGLSLWKRAQISHDNPSLERAQQLLARATELDPSFSLAYLQRGIVCTELHDIPSAISALQHAVTVNPSLADAHYRLAQLYRRSGNEADATRELALYRQSTASAEAEEERERHEIQQFVIQPHEPEQTGP
jgi:tetratricopeptide (TPR) repeat protein